MIRRRSLSPDELFHLRRIAFHEAGHATIAAHYGVTGEIRLHPVSDKPGDFIFNGIFHPDRPLPDREANRQCGLAGVLAESIDGKWDAVAHILVGKLMSDSDVKLAGDFERHHVVETIGLLRWLWSEVECRAEDAMKLWLAGPMVAFEGVSALAALPGVEEMHDNSATTAATSSEPLGRSGRH